MEAIRIKLKFENPSILTRKQMAEGVAQCWFPLRRSLHSIADLAADIISSFQLQQTCPHGISLSMEDFALLPFESISLLKEKDLLSVKERIKVDLLEPFNVKDIDTRICEDSATTNGAFYHQVGNFNLRALEEFEKESGGYRSEEEDTRLDLLAENGNGKEASKEVHGILEPHFEKRRSSKVEQRLLSSDKAMKKQTEDWEATIEENGEVEHQKKRRKQQFEEAEGRSERKKHKREKHAMDEKALGDGNLSIEDKKLKRSKCMPESEDDENVHETQTETRALKVTLNKAAENEVDLAGHAEKLRPSRSARRKKAKRQWLRIHAEQQHQVERGKLEAHPTIFSKDERVGELSLNTDLAIHGRKKTDNAEAKGERQLQPMVVAPGHIRFEPLDSDGENDKNQTPMLVIRINNDIKSKKQGRCWGKEIVEKGNHKNINESATGPDALGEAVVQIVSNADKKILTNFEALSSLHDFPREGDILAYRLVELTSNWTPELSPYRVGRVSKCDKDSCILKLDPVPGYSLNLKMDAADVCSDDRFNEQENLCAPYNEDGSLEIELSSLSDVRFVQRICSVDSAIGAGDLESNQIHENDKQVLSPAKPQDNDEMIVTPGCKEEDFHGRVNTSSMWQEISEELDRKKMQLIQMDSCKSHHVAMKDASEKIQEAGACLKEAEWKPSEAENQLFERENHRPKAGKDRKLHAKFLKSGALGPTIALLRAQQVL
ncbi:hypothetical protein O6H91_20G017700 [Diphasiastrum complanatum]|uniref:Uncharacterized protein n=1 Tax=Diphasiastrum complanatum TaxID=34168 RepID=A0ACC2AN39_DIPCM|nr:hypothetical protein O6H91_20G017700 [Diphasiastrum complanatum]